MSEARPDLSPEDEAALAALADGRLSMAERVALEGRMDSEPELAAALGRQRAALSVITSAVEGTSAPLALRARIEALQAQPPPPRSWRERMRESLAAIPLRAIAGATAAAAVAIALVVSGSGPGLNDVISAASGSPTAAIAPFPAQSKLLNEQIEGVRFPNYAGKFGWKATGSRTDEIDGRRTRTVYYSKDGRTIAYTIVGGEALPEPKTARPATREGTRLRSLEAKGRNVVTWRRQDHTCVLSGKGVPSGELLTLAGWHAKGEVKF
jgi:hypothetical protein